MAAISLPYKSQGIDCKPAGSYLIYKDNNNVNAFAFSFIFQLWDVRIAPLIRNVFMASVSVCLDISLMERIVLVGFQGIYLALFHDNNYLHYF